VGKLWTIEDVTFLGANYPIYGAAKCALALSRTIDAVYRKANNLKISAPKANKSMEQYISELPENYKLLEPYQTNKTPVLHKHLVCGYEWLVRPSNILSDYRCPKCSNKAEVRTAESYINALPDEYKLVEDYVNTKTPILHEHLMCGHIWYVRPGDILSGKGCPNCAKSGFKFEKPGTLYHVKIKDNLYKIGITNKTPKERFGSDWSKFNIEVIWQIDFISGRIAYTLEQKLLKAYKHLLVNAGLLISGNTETVYEEIPCPI